MVLIEMQGALDVEGSPDGQFVGKLTVDDETVSTLRICVIPHFNRVDAIEKADTPYWAPPAGGQTREPS